MYFVCSNLGENAQPIYKKYQSPSSQLIKCLNADFQNLLISGFDYNFNSEACGFIVSLIMKKAYFEPMTVSKGALNW